MVKILKGGLKQSKVPVKAAEPSLLSNIQRIGTSTGLKALEGAENLANLVTLPLQLLTRPISQVGTAPGSQPNVAPSQALMQKFGLTPEYLAPQNYPEAVAQRFAEKAPGAALFGLPSLVASGAGSLVGGALQQAGLPEGVQSLGELGTEIATGLYGGNLQKPSQVIRQAQKGIESSVPQGSTFAAPEIIEALNSISGKLGTEVSKEVSNKINHAIRITGENLYKNKISPLKALELRKNLYSLSDEVSKSKAAEYIQPLTQGINKFFASYGAENPQFYKHLNVRDRLTEMRNMKPLIDGFMEKLGINKIPVLSAATSKIYGKSIGQVDKLVRSLAKNSEARKYWFNMTKSAVKQDPNLFIKNLVQFNDEYEAPKETVQPSFKVLKGGLKKS